MTWFKNIFITKQITCESNLDHTWLIQSHIDGIVNVTIGVSPNNHCVRPAWNQSRYVFTYDWLPENGSVQNITNCTIRTTPHFLQLVLSHSLFVRCYCGTLYSNVMFKDSMCSINGHLIIGFIAVRKTEIVVNTIDLSRPNKQP